MSQHENDTLYQRIRAGDKSAIDEMIVGNLPLVKSRVGQFLKEYRRFRHLFDDLYGEGILALTEAVNSFATTEADKPTGCIVSAIDFALKNYVDSEIGAGMMSRRTVQRRRSRDESLPEQLPIDVAKPPANIWRNASGHVIRKQIGGDENLPLNAPQVDNEFGRKSRVNHTDAEQLIARYELDGQTDLLDSILACCESDEEKAIVGLRIDGFTDAEIGEQLGLSRATINRRRNEIEKRMKKARP